MIGGLYVVLIVAMLAADAAYLVTDPTGRGDDGVVAGLGRLVRPLAKPEIRYAVKLSLISCAITAILSVWVAVPLGYLMSRYDFRGKGLVDAVLDIPIVLPPLVVGLSLLILFQTAAGPGGRARASRSPTRSRRVILAQFAVACAFAVRTMRVTFDQISPRREQVALTLGCTRGQAFWRVVLPEARRRDGDGGDAGLGAGAGRVRADPRLRRRDADADGGAVDHGLPGAERRQPGGGRRGVAADGAGGGGGAGRAAAGPAGRAGGGEP